MVTNFDLETYSSTQDWVSISGVATTVSNEDPRIKELYNPALSAWFGDLGDGVHNGKPEDPRMSLIEVQPKYISYWKSTVTSLGFLKEVAVGAWKGQVANTYVLFQLSNFLLRRRLNARLVFLSQLLTKPVPNGYILWDIFANAGSGET